MKHVLSGSGLRALERVARSRVLLAFDFDGTLAPIIADPARAAMRSRTRALLEQVARRYPCIVISGRAQADVLRRMRTVGVHGVIGNHGIEPWRATGALLSRVQAWRPSLERDLEGVQGLLLEDKGFSLSIHYREASHKARARRTILAAAGTLDGVRLIAGKQIVNIVPAGAPHKGQALERERRRFGCEQALYVGDDSTDEDAFALAATGKLLAVRVGRRRDSAASHYLRSQLEIDRLLVRLLELRPSEGAHVPWRGR